MPHVDPRVVAEVLYGARERPAPPAAGSTSGPVLVRLADVEPEDVSWLWPGRLARGKLTVLVGEPGVGKSFLTLDVAARFSRGAAWPDGGRAPLGDVILLSAEDGVADTIRPRLDALEGDPARVAVLTAVRNADGIERGFCLTADLPALEDALDRTRGALVVIDPLSAYLGDRDSYKDAEVRALLAPVAALAERKGVAILAVMHPGKDSQRRAIHRALGAVAFVAAARIVLAAGKDRDDEARRLLAPVKANLSAPAATLAYRIAGTPARLEWEAGAVEGVTADDVLGTGLPENRDERRDADELLRTLLRDGEVKSQEVYRAAEAYGISRRGLWAAKRRLGVRAHHDGQPGRAGCWYWAMAESEASKSTADEAPKGTTQAEAVLFEQHREETNETARTSPKSIAAQNAVPFGGTLRAPEPAAAAEWDEV